MNLEKFIRDNRDAFEQAGPSAGLWERIADQLPDEPAAKPVEPFKTVHRQRTRYGGTWTRSYWTWAASIALLLLAGGLWWANDRYRPTAQPDVVAFSPTYAREVAQYASLIDSKRAELKQLTESNPDLYGEFAQDLNRLEASYKGLKKELPNTPNQEVLIQAMIQNLQLQIDLLNEQLRVIQRIKQQTSHEPV
ncbi:hypothetical protein [Fibrivirga algicola]|uniref:Anti-sigma factor n=1 Tax=Fibrivirga algicola TaxID=2950420 RepID=A0ABX0Q9D5_9BACT|nr:hypothetical protein [Fibrivirga algicola]ARK09159.1 hypothetical protein A6C57_01835 [Fibrella sp. ES10-3-2-2]NID08726.1 hypothetical protein [Fibrivirga algicola]